MWCYSLRFPRIRRIKINQSFLDCLTFQELQGMGRDSISAIVSEKIPAALVDESYNSKPQKRVRFALDNQEELKEKLLKANYHVHLSRQIKLADRERLIEWLEYRGFELIWSYEAAIQFSERKIILIKQENDDIVKTDKISIVIPWNSVETNLLVENAYFRLQWT